MNTKIPLLLSLLLLACTLSAQVEVEPNNTIIQNTNANTFTAPETISASITRANPDDRDFFKIVLPHCGAWQFNLLNPSGNPCILKMHLYNAQNTSNALFGNGGWTFNFNNGLPDPPVISCGGTVFVQIDQTDGNDLGNYSLQVTEDPFNGYSCNSSFLSAPLIPLDTTIQERLWGYKCDGTVDEAFFKIKTNQCGVAEIGLGSIDPNQRMVLQVYDSSSNSLIDNYTASGNGANAFVATLLEAGTYFIKIKEWTGNCCSQGHNVYQLSTDPFQMDIEFDVTDVGECNNSFSTATPIATDTTLNASLWGVNYSISDGEFEDRDEDQDYYTIDIPQCGVLNIDLTGTGGNQRMQIHVYDSLETLVFYNRASTNGDNVSANVLTPQGKYYIRITEWTGGCCANGYNEYALVDAPYSLSTSMDYSDIAECNNSAPTAFPIPLDTTIETKLWGSNYTISDGQFFDRDQDQDFYSIDVTECGEWNMDINGANANMRLEITVFDTMMNTVAYSRANGNGGTVSLVTTLQSGPYFVRVSEWTGGCCDPGYNEYALADDPFFIIANFSPFANITYSTSNICPGDSIYFSAPGIIGSSWSWDFGPNANPTTSNQQYPGEVSFSSGGIQTITLTVDGCSTDSVNILVLPQTPIPTLTVQPQLLLSSAMYGNQWYFNGTPIAGADSFSLPVQQSGIYQVCVTDSITCGTACSDTVSVTLVNLPSIVGKESMTIFPNPTSGKIAVRIPESTIELTIVNHLGQVIDILSPQPGTARVDLEFRDSGVYFLSAITPTSKLTQKLVVLP